MQQPDSLFSRETVEVVAVAIYERLFDTPWGEAEPIDRILYRAAAREAIRAMFRRPSVRKPRASPGLR